MYSLWVTHTVGTLACTTIPPPTVNSQIKVTVSSHEQAFQRQICECVQAAAEVVVLYVSKCHSVDVKPYISGCKRT